MLNAGFMYGCEYILVISSTTHRTSVMPSQALVRLGEMLLIFIITK